MKVVHVVVLLALSAMVFSSCVARPHHYGVKHYKRANSASAKALEELDKE